MNRHKSKISKWNRRGDRARRKRQAEEHKDLPVTVIYDRDKGIGNLESLDGLRERAARG